MKFSEQWLREWVDPPVDTESLCEQLTMAGLEVDDVAPAAADLARVFVGRIRSVEPHPEADRLQVCEVDVGDQGEYSIVCGAENAAPGLAVPTALEGAKLPGGVGIVQTEVRGVASQGMLCAAHELGLGDDDSGLLVLDEQAQPGRPLAEHLGLDDRIIEIDLTPNRGDCLSLRGVAREVGVSNRLDVTEAACEPVATENDETLPVELKAQEACPAYAGRVIRNINPQARTPDWLRERLRRGGIRPVSVVVDITNYVMLELGQPLHAFDRHRLTGGIQVRWAGSGEPLQLLDGGEIELDTSSLVIADDSGPVALAGVMGGEATAVDGQTRDIFLESAYFTPRAVAGQGRLYKRHTDALHRFERGVDPALQCRAIERATRLLLDIAGGSPGPTELHGEEAAAYRVPIHLRRDRVRRLLGCDIDGEEVTAILERLGLQVEQGEDDAWRVAPPSYRFDLALEADLIEEIARVHGYNRLPERAQTVRPNLGRQPETRLAPVRIREALIQRGYHEAITYSFVAPGLQALLQPELPAVDLDNPIAEQYAQMRTSLWSSLLPAWQYNVRRQQPRVRLFEIGLRFLRDEGAELGIAQIPVVGGLLDGPAHAEHWDHTRRSVDFFDAKGDLQALLALGGQPEAYRFEPDNHPALHPGRSARLYCGDTAVGWLGQLHPEIGNKIKYKSLPILFEVDYETVREAALPRYETLSEFPSVRRDLALVVPESVSAGDLQATLEAADEPTLQSVHVFDVFYGDNLEKGFKSVALGLIFLNKSSTLEDEGVDASVSRLTALLAEQCGASIRGQ